MKRELICISCPRGCHLQAELLPDGRIGALTGNRCPRGEAYARQELTDPRRLVTAVVKCRCEGEERLVPVRTSAPYPKHAIPALLNRIYHMEIDGPVKQGDVLLDNLDGTGIDLLATE